MKCLNSIIMYTKGKSANIKKVMLKIVVELYKKEASN